MNKIFFFLPFLLFKVSGNSMLPAFVPGQKILIKKTWFFCTLRANDVVVLRDPSSKKLILKRIKKINSNLYFVLGDNEMQSTDSRIFGWVKKYDIIGKVIYGIYPF